MRTNRRGKFLMLLLVLSCFVLVAAAGAVAGVDPAALGNYKALTLTYGSGRDLHRPGYGRDAVPITEPVDATALLPAWQGKPGERRSKYWGFGPDRLPLNGRVWYPAGAGPFPLVLMVHGNHEMTEYSDPGYAYLGSFLASRGYIFVSVDENFLNGGRHYGDFYGQENVVRAFLLLQHLRIWHEWARQEGHPCYGLVDLDKIALMGHSRGGEAAALAAAMNKLPRHPFDARVVLGFNFAIKSVVAFAPADGQYKPADKPVALEDVNYLVLQGSQDADVSFFMGIRQYQRAAFTGRSYRFKSAVYIERANHGQFNTIWGANDWGRASKFFLDLKPLLPGEDQRRAALVYVAAFLDATLRGRSDFVRIFRDTDAAAPWLPRTSYLTQFEDSNYRKIADFEEDIDVTTASLPGATAEGIDLKLWREAGLRFRNWLPMENNAAILSWTGGRGEYVLTLPVSAWPWDEGDKLVFSLAELENDSDTSLDLTVAVEDASGHAARIALGAVRPLPRAIHVKFTKYRRTERWLGGSFEPVFQRYEIPLSTFAGLDPAALRRIRFVFDLSKEGTLALDEVGVRVE